MAEVKRITIPYKPREQFEPFHYRDTRWTCIVAHRRAGKTVACINDLIRRAIVDFKEHGRYAYVAPFYSQAKAVAWDYLLRYSEPVRTTANASELWVELLNGSRIRLFGADNPDALRGLYLDGVIMDEVADMRPRVWGEIVRPLLSDRKGWVVFIGTPKGKNEFWSIWQHASRDPDWLALMMRASETGLVDQSELLDAAKTMTEDQYQQEFECSFEAALLGAYYGREITQVKAENRLRKVPYEPEVPVHTAWDLGYSDDTAIWFYQVVNGEIRLLQHHATSGQAMDYYINHVNAQPYKYGTHWLPHDARAKTLASGGKSIQEQLSNAWGWGNVRIVPELSIQDGIQAARMMFPRCYFDLGTEDALETLAQYQREYDEEKKTFRDKPRHDWTSHTADAFRMLAVAWREEYKPKEPELPRYPVQQTINELIAENRRRKRDNG